MRWYSLLQLYFGLFFILLFIVSVFNETFLIVITMVYVFFAIIFLLFRFFAWFYSDYFKKDALGVSNKPYSVIIPVKDEDEYSLIRCLKSVVACSGRKQILIGDDGSSFPVEKIVKKYPSLYKKVTIIRSNENIGKKSMQMKLIKKCKYNILINIDSDVVIKDVSCLSRLIAPFNDSEVGLVNGHIKMFYNKSSILNRMQSFMYYCANQIGRKSWGYFGLNPVASGQMLAFRKDYFNEISSCYEHKKFLGKEILFGEDRLMTNLFLKQGYTSVYVEDAIAFSFPVTSFVTFIKQQCRWRRSGIRESVFALQFLKNKYLYFLIAGRLVLPILFSFLFFNLIFYYMINLYLVNILVVLFVLFLVTLISDLPMLLENPKRILDLVVFSLFNIFFLSPLWIYALFTLNRTGWGTR